MAGVGKQTNKNLQETLAMAEHPLTTTTSSPSFPQLSHSHGHSHSQPQFNFNPSPSISGERPSHPQWNHHETVELISIRGELEREFMASKRNKVLWETVALRMRERGFCRTPDQCKCKWKNLVNRYKGKETSDADNGKQCPFFEELHSVFSQRAKNLQQSFAVSQPVSVQSKKRTKSTSGGQYSEDFSEDEGDGEDSEEESLIRSSTGRKRKAERDKPMQPITRDKSAGPNNACVVDISSSSSIQEMLKVFMQQQQRIEMQWRESMERHRHERDLFERDWRESMEKLERERLMMEQEWREREEQWKMREEIRAEKRDALLTMLLNKLISEDHL